MSDAASFLRICDVNGTVCQLKNSTNCIGDERLQSVGRHDSVRDP